MTLPDTGHPAPDLEIDMASGQKTRLSAFWQNGPAVLVFLRHFG